MSTIIWSSVNEDEDEVHLCGDCGTPCSIEEPICWTCECGETAPSTGGGSGVIIWPSD